MIARRGAYHGCSLGALSLTGIPAARAPFEPLLGDARHVANTDGRNCPICRDTGNACIHAADAVEQAILAEGPDTVALVIVEPVQNAGGCLVPPPGYAKALREICDRYGVLLCCDEVITGYGRLGEWFGSTRLGFEPDIITSAKGMTSGYAPLGGVLFSDRVAEPFIEAKGMYTHGYTFGGHPLSCAIALENLAIMDELDVLQNVRDTEAYLESTLNDVAARLADRGRGARRGLLPRARARVQGAARTGPRGDSPARRDRAPRRSRAPVPRDLAAAHLHARARRRARRGPAGGARGGRGSPRLRCCCTTRPSRATATRFGCCWPISGSRTSGATMDVVDRSDRPDVLSALNPALRVPTLVFDDGRSLGESNAIIWYLADGTPWIPDDPFERAQVLQWQFFEQYDHEPNIAVARFMLMVSGEPERYAAELPARQAGGYRALDAMERHLDGPCVPRRRLPHARGHLAVRLHARRRRGRARHERLPRDRRVARQDRRPAGTRGDHHLRHTLQV